MGHITPQTEHEIKSSYQFRARTRFTGIKRKYGNFDFLEITIVMIIINKILKPRYLLVLLVLGGGALLTMLQATSNECFSTAD